MSYEVRLCTPLLVPVDMFAAVEWKKLMCCLFKGIDVTTPFLAAAVDVDLTGVICLTVV